MNKLWITFFLPVDILWISQVVDILWVTYRTGISLASMEISKPAYFSVLVLAYSNILLLDA